MTACALASVHLDPAATWPRRRQTFLPSHLCPVLYCILNDEQRDAPGGAVVRASVPPDEPCQKQVWRGGASLAALWHPAPVHVRRRPRKRHARHRHQGLARARVAPAPPPHLAAARRRAHGEARWPPLAVAQALAVAPGVARAVCGRPARVRAADAAALAQRAAVAARVQRAHGARAAPRGIPAVAAVLARAVLRLQPLPHALQQGRPRPLPVPLDAHRAARLLRLGGWIHAARTGLLCPSAHNAPRQLDAALFQRPLYRQHRHIQCLTSAGHRAIPPGCPRLHALVYHRHLDRIDRHRIERPKTAHASARYRGRRLRDLRGLLLHVLGPLPHVARHLSRLAQDRRDEYAADARGGLEGAQIAPSGPAPPHVAAGIHPVCVVWLVHRRAGARAPLRRARDDERQGARAARQRHHRLRPERRKLHREQEVGTLDDDSRRKRQASPDDPPCRDDLQPAHFANKRARHPVHRRRRRVVRGDRVRRADEAIVDVHHIAKIGMTRVPYAPALLGTVIALAPHTHAAFFGIYIERSVCLRSPRVPPSTVSLRYIPLSRCFLRHAVVYILAPARLLCTSIYSVRLYRCLHAIRSSLPFLLSLPLSLVF